MYKRQFAHICGLGSPAQKLGVFALVDNCSVTRATHRGDYWYLSTLNERAHLDSVNREQFEPD